ncbi:hypothetical protein [Pedobacter sp. JY14-1]|uniref:ACP phosphodiesterase n=1 Tax=Pedobacter sp. JY14-1 TaxID=3034151 RepID=UPI0023E16EFA|nr:hypothetical protein [Pedobacter sp. JY14-1]
MNFLSHFYFDRQNDNTETVLGIVLPDLIKNAWKDVNLYPLKERHLFIGDVKLLSILEGWERHLGVDAVFHSSSFFREQTAGLKQLLLPFLGDSPVKPFFLAHIGLELLLDHLLIEDKLVSTGRFYELLTTADRETAATFLRKCGVTDTAGFFAFLNGFISSRYLLSYQKLENITYALNRICMRLWMTPFNADQLEKLTTALGTFKEQIKPVYRNIFTEISTYLEKGTA